MKRCRTYAASVPNGQIRSSCIGKPSGESPPWINWQNLFAAVLIIVLSGILIDRLTYGDCDQIIVLVVNVSAALLIFALFTSMLAGFIPPLKPVATGTAICLAISGTFLVLTTVIASRVLEVPPELAEHLAHSLMVLVVFGLMYWFVFAATLQLRWIGAIRRDTSRVIDLLAKWIDRTTFALATIVTLVALFLPEILPPLFLLWSAVMILLGGLHLWGGDRPVRKGFCTG